MNSLCPVTGGDVCHCDAMANLDHTRDTIRRLFTEHGVYTSALIMDSIPFQGALAQPSTPFQGAALTLRLLRNVEETREAFAALVGEEKADAFAESFAKHVAILGSVLKAEDDEEREELKEEFLTQAAGELSFVTADLSTLENESWVEEVGQLVSEHANIDVQLVEARLAGDADLYIALNDRALLHLLMFADVLYEELK